MLKYVIEREIPNAGELTEEELRDVSLRSIAVLDELGPAIQWLHSFVTDDKESAVNRPAFGCHATAPIFDGNEVAVPTAAARARSLQASSPSIRRCWPTIPT